MVNAPETSAEGGSAQPKKGLMRPGVEDGQEDKIEESLENLDHLLNNIKSKDPKKREQEILRLG